MVNRKSSFFVIIIMTFMFLPLKNIAQSVSHQQAENIILQMYSDTIYDTYQIYSCNNLISEDEYILSIFDTITMAESDSYLFFVDEVPYGNWAHSCKYILVNSSNGSITNISADMHPNLEDYTIIKETSIDYNSVIMSPNFSKYPQESKACDNNESQYAVIIGGGSCVDDNYARYWNDCSFIYNTLIHTYGYKKSNVYVLMADGQNPGADLSTGNGFVSSPLDLDGDNIADIGYATTKQNISNVFNELSTKMNAGDNLFIYTIGHGNYDIERGSFLALWGGVKFFANDLLTEINKINYQCIVNVVMGQCNAGGFSNWLNNRTNTVSTFAVTQDRPSATYADLPFDIFVELFTSAIKGRDYFGNIVDADINNDGEISMYEAYIYAFGQDNIDNPFQRSNPSQLKEVLTMCNKKGVDLVIKDGPEDSGKEPNTVSEYLYQSSDIYVSLSDNDYVDGEHQNPISGQTAHVYVKVKNNGYATYKPENNEGKLSLYWAKAGIGLSWPEPWQGSEINGLELGGLIGTKNIVDTLLPYYNGFNAGLERVYHFEWNVPNIEDYADLPENWHFCLLAVMDSEIDPLTDPDCIGDLTRFVKNNNNVAWKNITIIDEENINNPAYVSMTNWTGKNFRGEIIFEVPKNETSPLLSDVAEIVVTFNEEIYQTILDNWNLTYGLEKSRKIDNSFIITKDSASISGLLFEQEELNLLGLSVNFYIDKDSDKEDYKYNITLRNLETNTIVGGEQYVIHKPELRQEIVVNAGEDQIVTLGETVTLSAQRAGENVSYKWIDSYSDTMINNQIAEVTPTETQQYKLEVKTDNGYIGYDSLNVVVKKNIINNITPQPATDFAVINYQIMQANNAYIEITNGFGTVLENFQINTELNQYSFDCSSLPSGIYTVILYCDGYRQDAKNLIIE
ncbi:MAG: hypothetical protein U0L57_05120 [Bacteroidales bacterium]|nr:hypothetical protein [Bacteroidales bacterium]